MSMFPSILLPPIRGHDCRIASRLPEASSQNFFMKLLSKIFISQSTDFHFAKYRFHFAKYRFHFAKYRFPFRKAQISIRKVQISFRKVQIFISQSTDFHFAKYRFHFVSFRFAKYHFAKYNKPPVLSMALKAMLDYSK